MIDAFCACSEPVDDQRHRQLSFTAQETITLFELPRASVR